MNILDKILFLAYKIGRKDLNDEMLKIKELSYQYLDQALVDYLYYMKKSLEANNKKIHHDSLELLNKLK